MQKKYQVFISSTYRDLIDERQAITRSVLDLGHIPSGMELFPAADEEQFSYIKKVIDQCDYYVLVIAGRYGSVDANGVSYTEKEYDYAVETGKTVLTFIHKERDKLPRNQTEDDAAKAARLEAFIEKSSSGRLAKFWATIDELDLRVTKSLSMAFTERPGIGWVRASGTSQEELLQKIEDVRSINEQLTAERNELKLALQAMKQANKPVLVGLAGLDASLEIGYQYRYHQHGTSYIGKASLDCTWSKLFGHIAPQFTKPTNSAQLASFIELFIKEETGRIGDVKQSCVNTVRIHLEALKLIRVFESAQVNGGVGEFMQVTDHGRRTLLELLAVRSEPRASGAGEQSGYEG